jgi:hypothetical protein
MIHSIEIFLSTTVSLSTDTIHQRQSRRGFSLQQHVVSEGGPQYPRRRYVRSTYRLSGVQGTTERTHLLQPPLPQSGSLPVSVAACERLPHDADLGGSLPQLSHVVVSLNLRHPTAVSHGFLMRLMVSIVTTHKLLRIGVRRR